MPGQKPPQITSIAATFVMPITTYKATASDPNNDKLTYQWANSNPCGVFTFSGPTATWLHPDSNQPGACPVEPVHPGTIAVVVSDGYYGCVGQYDKGSAQGEEKQPMKTPCKLLAGHTRPK